MTRLLAIAGLALALVAVSARAADSPLAGSWKLTVPLEPGQDVTFLVALSEKGGAWVGEVTGATVELSVQPKIVDLAVDGNKLRFAVELGGQKLLAFDGVLAKDGKSVAGSYVPAGGKARVTELRPSKLKTLADEYDVARETLEQTEGGQVLFDAAFVVLGHSGAKKLPADEARRIVERVVSAAANYGPRWERETARRLATTLAAQPGLADLAVEQARRAEKMLTPADDIGIRTQVLDALVLALTRAGKPDDAAKYRDEIAAIEAKQYAEYAKTHPPFKPEPFAGRKGKSNRAVLCELFTGAECPPCAAAGLAFDGLMRTFKPADAILLEYHCHIPVPDPLTSPDAEERMRYYADQMEGAPTLFVGGELGPPPGGPPVAAEKKYKAIRAQIENDLEKPAGVKLVLAVSKTAKGFDVKASVTELDKPGEKVRLRFALAEERVRFAGGNGVGYHHMVVRSMPGGPKGFALTKKAEEQTVSVNPDELREVLAKYLDRVPKDEGPFPRTERPLALNNLKVVAFVQDDATRQILHAVQVDLAAK